MTSRKENSSITPNTKSPIGAWISPEREYIEVTSRPAGETPLFVVTRGTHAGGVTESEVYDGTAEDLQAEIAKYLATGWEYSPITMQSVREKWDREAKSQRAKPRGRQA